MASLEQPQTARQMCLLRQPRASSLRQLKANPNRPSDQAPQVRNELMALNIVEHLGVASINYNIVVCGNPCCIYPTSIFYCDVGYLYNPPVFTLCHALDKSVIWTVFLFALFSCFVILVLLYCLLDK